MGPNTNWLKTDEKGTGRLKPKLTGINQEQPGIRFLILVPGNEIFDLPGYWFGGFERFKSSWVNQEVQALLLVQSGNSWFNQQVSGLIKLFMLKPELVVTKPRFIFKDGIF